MSSQELPDTPSRLENLNTEQLRQRLAGLIDTQAEKSKWFSEQAKDVAIQFAASLPAVFSDSLDRLTMWDKIASAIKGGFAKTAGGDLDLFIQHVMETIKADESKAVSCEKLVIAIDCMHAIDDEHRQDFLQYFVTHLIPILVHSRRLHKIEIEERRP